VRFASSSTGFAWIDEGSLWRTVDGGVSWRTEELTEVRSLETSSGLVWALAGEVPYPKVWRTTLGSTHWTKLGTTPDRGGSLDVHGSTAYVMGFQGAGPVPPSLDVWSGTHKRNEELPCSPGRIVPFSPIGVSTDGSLFLVCNVSNGDTQQQLAYRSSDQGRHWSEVQPPPFPPDDVTAVSGRRFAWQSDLSVYDGSRWRVSLNGPGTAPDNGAAFVLVGFQDSQHGVALTATGRLSITRDAGRTWRSVTF
jgi:hypothetical protein